MLRSGSPRVSQRPYAGSSRDRTQHTHTPSSAESDKEPPSVTYPTPTTEALTRSLATPLSETEAKEAPSPHAALSTSKPSTAVPPGPPQQWHELGPFVAPPRKEKIAQIHSDDGEAPSTARPHDTTSHHPKFILTSTEKLEVLFDVTIAAIHGSYDTAHTVFMRRACRTLLFMASSGFRNAILDYAEKHESRLPDVLEVELPSEEHAPAFLHVLNVVHEQSPWKEVVADAYDLSFWRRELEVLHNMSFCPEHFNRVAQSLITRCHRTEESTHAFDLEELAPLFNKYSLVLSEAQARSVSEFVTFENILAWDSPNFQQLLAVSSYSKDAKATLCFIKGGRTRCSVYLEHVGRHLYELTPGYLRNIMWAYVKQHRLVMDGISEEDWKWLASARGETEEYVDVGKVFERKPGENRRFMCRGIVFRCTGDKVSVDEDFMGIRLQQRVDFRGEVGGFGRVSKYVNQLGAGSVFQCAL